MAKIVEVHHGGFGKPSFKKPLRDFTGSKLPTSKAPSTSELIDWIGALVKGG